MELLDKKQTIKRYQDFEEAKPRVEVLVINAGDMAFRVSFAKITAARSKE